MSGASGSWARGIVARYEVGLIEPLRGTKSGSSPNNARPTPDRKVEVRGFEPLSLGDRPGLLRA